MPKLFTHKAPSKYILPHTRSDLEVLKSHKHLFLKNSGYNSLAVKYKGPHFTKVNLLGITREHTSAGRGDIKQNVGRGCYSTLKVPSDLTMGRFYYGRHGSPAVITGMYWGGGGM